MEDALLAVLECFFHCPWQCHGNSCHDDKPWPCQHCRAEAKAQVTTQSLEHGSHPSWFTHTREGYQPHLLYNTVCNSVTELNRYTCPPSCPIPLKSLGSPGQFLAFHEKTKSKTHGKWTRYKVLNDFMSNDECIHFAIDRHISFISQTRKKWKDARTVLNTISQAKWSLFSNLMVGGVLEVAQFVNIWRGLKGRKLSRDLCSYSYSH